MKILIFCLPGIGDALMATPMIKILKKEIPSASLDVATMFHSVSYIFKNNRAIENVYCLPLYRENTLIGLRKIFALRKNNYDVSLLAFPAFRKEYHIVQWLVGARKRLAHRFHNAYFSEFHFLNTDLIPADLEEHNVINNLNLLHVLNIEWEKKNDRKSLAYEMHIGKEDSLFGTRFIESLGWNQSSVVGIHPGSVDSKAGVLKRWPVEKFAKVARYLIDKKKQKIIIFVGPFETHLGDQLYQEIAGVQDSKLIKGMEFPHVLGVLERMRFLITNDNGFSHLANAMHVPTITLFGPTDMRVCAPYDNRITINIRKAAFTPWFGPTMRVSSPPANAESGMERIQVADVIKEINNIVKK